MNAMLVAMICAVAASPDLGRSQAKLAAAVIDTARLQQRQGKWAEALQLVESALQNVDAAEPAWSARLAVRRGALLITQARRKTGEWDRAIDALKDAVGQARQVRDPEALGAGLDQLGLALHHRTLFTGVGDYVAAEAALTEALRIRTEAGDDRERADVLFHLGLCAEHAGRREDAFQTYRKALAVAQRAKYHEGVSQAHRHLGSLHEESRDWPRALDHFHKALAATRQAGDRFGMAPALSAVADTMIAAGGDSAQARRLLQDALAEATELNDLAYVAVTRLSLGRLDQTAAQRDAATLHLKEALRAASTIKDERVAAEARKRLADLGASP